MRGHMVFLAIIIAVLLLLPTLFVKKEPIGQPVVEETTVKNTDAFTVLHADQEKVSELSAQELTLYSVIGSVDADVPKEAIKAQAVAVYTLYCYQKETSPANAAADILSTPIPFPEAFCEAYWQQQWGETYEKTMAVYRDAVEEVFGQRLLYDGKSIMALSHTMNAGMTESAQVYIGESLPYLVSVESKADTLDERQLTTVTLPIEEAIATLEALCGTSDLGEVSEWIGERVCSDAGTVTSVTLCGKTLSGTAVQEAFSLPSAAFEVCVQEEQMIFTVKGNGHFVGMSLCGAAAMAKEGKTYHEILNYYYPGTTVE